MVPNIPFLVPCGSIMMAHAGIGPVASPPRESRKGEVVLPGRLRTVFWSGMALSVVMLAIALGMAMFGARQGIGPAVVLSFTSLAVAFMAHPVLRSVSFTAWVFAFVAASLCYPAAFDQWYGFQLKILIVPLIQIIMFGMGTTLSVRDFTRVLTIPWPVFIGMLLQFTVMPLAGLTIATVFQFEPEVAAGVILVGSVPGGVASNLMTYLARGDVALSVTMTSCETDQSATRCSGLIGR